MHHRDGSQLIGRPMHRRSTILKVAEKTGSTGRMVFVTVGHEIEGPEGLAVREEQDIVYVAMPDRFIPPPPVPAPEGAAWSHPVTMDTVRIFRFSALTFNAHRIHYDRDYARDVEGYAGLVVHGPLIATLLIDHAQRIAPDIAPRHFSFRAEAPLTDGAPFDLCFVRAGDGARLLARDAAGRTTMRADMAG